MRQATEYLILISVPAGAARGVGKIGLYFPSPGNTVGQEKGNSGSFQNLGKLGLDKRFCTEISFEYEGDIV